MPSAFSHTSAKRSSSRKPSRKVSRGQLSLGSLGQKISAPKDPKKEPGGADRGELTVCQQGKEKGRPIKGQGPFPRLDGSRNACNALRSQDLEGHVPLQKRPGSPG